MDAGGSEAFLGSRYVLLDEIGAGAMGTVWRARHRETGETVAVKMLRSNLTGDQDLVLRFVQERNVLRTLTHPNIVTMRDFVIEGERLALVMDLVEGGDLRGLLRRHGTLPPATAAELMAQVADALAAAHAVGVVHRDVKPGNVLIDGPTGQVRLTDFGVARIVLGPGLTQTTSIIGTPTYLSPEVADGGAPTPAVDVYAAGLILYELLAGRPPFVGDHPMALLRQHAMATPRRLPGMPDALWALVVACTAKDPAGRPAAGQVAAALREAVPSLRGLAALPPVAKGEAPAATSEPLPARPVPAGGAQGPASPDARLPSGAGPAPGDGGPRAEAGTVPGAGGALGERGAGPGTGGALGERGAGPGTGGGPGRAGAVASGRGGRDGRGRRRTVVVASTAAAVVLTAVAVAVVAPWRTPDADAVNDAAGLPVAKPVEVAGTATPVTPVPSASEGEALKSSPKKTSKPSKEPTRTPEPAVSKRSTPPSATVKPSTGRTADPSRSPTGRKTETPHTVDPGTDKQTAPPRSSEPVWKCRSWISTGNGTGTEMSPCMAMVGDVFYLMGRIRGASSVRSDVHVQLFDTDADRNVSQPFVCSGVSPRKDGEVATCGPFTTTAPHTQTKHDVRQRWRRAGAPAFGGGAESPWIIW
ncbi:hypothetical protein DMB42_44100 [Nonomuraea sp. WAC 01424]|uniref:serine/threonine-protein kinase n=1 Tax=Nonomuraea sp. WAC 01424 TaxID=2203200 RepID=UPI000F7B9234|nr:serine/threonine-protein kinase [Nonomuraea sp. WAC 01424]RSM98733.1 hypothetical protein DMB42_44100 [Nonomuraea sp. WAC 01424]